MNDRSSRIFKLLNDTKSRTSYIKAKLGVLVPAQIRALRLKSTSPAMPKQSDLAREACTHQSRISMFETPGAANMTLETLAQLASALKVGLVVKFVPFCDMLRWENEFHQDSFDVLPRLEEDEVFLNPSAARVGSNAMATGNVRGVNDLAFDLREPKARVYEIAEGSYRQSSGLGQKIASGGA